MDSINIKLFEEACERAAFITASKFPSNTPYNVVYTEIYMAARHMLTILICQYPSLICQYPSMYDELGFKAHLIIHTTITKATLWWLCNPG